LCLGSRTYSASPMESVLVAEGWAVAELAVEELAVAELAAAELAAAELAAVE
jgi:hypothetical protein